MKWETRNWKTISKPKHKDKNLLITKKLYHYPKKIRNYVESIQIANIKILQMLKCKKHKIIKIIFTIIIFLTICKRKLSKNRLKSVIFKGFFYCFNCCNV